MMELSAEQTAIIVDAIYQVGELVEHGKFQLPCTLMSTQQRQLCLKHLDEMHPNALSCQSLEELHDLIGNWIRNGIHVEVPGADQAFWTWYLAVYRCAARYLLGAITPVMQQLVTPEE